VIKISVDKKYFYIMGILKIAKDLGVSVGATRLQKVVFLVKEELNFNIGYKFIPYYFGPFSKELQDGVYKLKNLGYVEIKEEIVEDLGDSGLRAIQGSFANCNFSVDLDLFNGGIIEYI